MQFGGQVRAADQMVPGATVTALQGGAKVTAFTDENGRYTLELTPGVWQIEISMFEFTTAKGQVTVSDGDLNARLGVEHAEALRTRWTHRRQPAPAAVPLPAAPGVGRGRAAHAAIAVPDGQRAGGNFPGRGRSGGLRGRARAQGPGRGVPGQPQPGFQSAAVRATPEGQQANAQAQIRRRRLPTSAARRTNRLLVNGSISGGLEQSSDDEARRQRAMGGRGGPEDRAVPVVPAARAARFRRHRVIQMSTGLPPGMSANLTNDSLGLGGFGASAINGGFGVGAAAPPDGGGRGGGRQVSAPARGPAVARRRLRRRRWRRRWWRRRRTRRRTGTERAADAGRRGRGGRGPFNGQFASFGNRRRTTPPVQGSVALTVRNSAFNAAPYSLNGQTAQKPYSANNNLNANIGGPLHIPKIVNWHARPVHHHLRHYHQPERPQHDRVACPRRRSAPAISRRRSAPRP